MVVGGSRGKPWYAGLHHRTNWSGKRQAASGKRQAASGKRQAASGKRISVRLALKKTVKSLLLFCFCFA